MYTAFYGLREKPFALSPDPRFLYLAGSHREALAHLLYGIEQGEGFIAVTGEVGTGKTTLCRTLLERLEGETEIAFLFNPSRTAHELLQSICAEFALPAEGLARRTLMSQLNTHLLDQKRKGRRVLLIVDEAQTLGENTLEQVRLLSNLETSREKLIQILLLGQPELDRKLDEPGLRQLRQRISVRWKLEPLGAQETRAYVRHRIAVAAGEPRELFSEAALREIHRRTGGVPRLVNQLCDRALLAGYAARAAQIGPALVRAAAREIPDAQRPRSSTPAARSGGPRRPWLFLAASLGLVALALIAGLQLGRSGLSSLLNAPGALFGSSEATPRSASTQNAEQAQIAARSGTASDAPNADTQTSVEPLPLARPIGFVSPETAGGVTPPVAARPGALADPGSVQPAPGASIDASESRPEVTALAPDLLRRLLETRSPQVALAESQRALLERFGRRVPALSAAPRSPDELRASLEARGLQATPFDGGSLGLLRRLDHPVVLALDATRPDGLASSGSSDASSTSSNEATGATSSRPTASTSERASTQKWVALIGFDTERAYVAGLLSDRISTVPIEELEAHWLETGIVVWERFESVPGRLAEGDEGKGVLWLQRALSELRFYDGRPSGEFDSETRNALIAFQNERGLVGDGIAGTLSQIALYARLVRYPVPRLSRFTTPNTASARPPVAAEGPAR
jgi:general secretion pathway protein A